MFRAEHSPVMRGVLELIDAVSSKVEDAGLYTCLASSPAGEDGKNHWIRVQGDSGCACSALEEISSSLPSAASSLAPGTGGITLCVNSGVTICVFTENQNRPGLWFETSQLQFSRSFCFARKHSVQQMFVSFELFLSGSDKI